MAGTDRKRLALLLRSGPYLSREARAEVDLALAALSLDFEVEVYFFGDAVMQLASEKSASASLLPAGYKAWSAMPDLGEVSFYAESGLLRRCANLGIELILPVEGLGSGRMKSGWRDCNQVLVL